MWCRKQQAESHSGGGDLTKGDTWTAIEPSRGWLRPLDLHEFWAYRELVRVLALRDLKLRYKQTLLGVAWALIQPLTAALIFTVVFGRLAHLPAGGVPYVVFVYSGLCIWTYVSSAVQAAAESLVQDNKLVTSVYFPRQLAPLASILPGVVDLAVALCILAGLMVIRHVHPSWPLLTLPLWVLAAAVLAFGVGIWLAGLNVLYRDVRYTFTFLLQVWLFASPVVYSTSLVKGGWRYVFAANPLVGLLDGFRWAALNAGDLDLSDLVSLATGLAILTTGVIYFASVSRQLADRI